MEAWIFWLIVAAIAFIAEAATAGLVSLWFGCAALVTSLMSFFMSGVFESQILFVILQIVVFCILSVVFLYLMKPLSAKYIKKEPTNAEMIIGKTAVVLEDIDNLNGTGSVKIAGTVWSARSKDNIIIKKDELVTVDGISGVCAVVACPEKVE